MSFIKRKLKIYGRVQGVFFRASVKEVCQRENVSCEAMNMPDGTVEVYLEGEEDAVSRVTEWCKTGPPLAKVERVEIQK